MAVADDLALDAEHVAQADIEPVGEHDQPRRDLLAVGQRDLLPLGAVGDGDDLGVDGFDTRREFAPRIVLTSVSYRMPCWSLGLLGDDVAEARFPDLAVERRRAQGRLGEAGLAQEVELIAAEFLAAQLRRIGRMRVDQDAPRCRRGRASPRRSSRRDRRRRSQRPCTAWPWLPSDPDALSLSPQRQRNPERTQCKSGRHDESDGALNRKASAREHHRRARRLSGIVSDDFCNDRFTKPGPRPALGRPGSACVIERVHEPGRVAGGQ